MRSQAATVAEAATGSEASTTVPLPFDSISRMPPSPCTQILSLARRSKQWPSLEKRIQARSIPPGTGVVCQDSPKIIVSEGGNSSRGWVSQREQGSELAGRAASEIVDGAGNVGTTQLPHA